MASIETDRGTKSDSLCEVLPPVNSQSYAVTQQQDQLHIPCIFDWDNRLCNFAKFPNKHWGWGNEIHSVNGMVRKLEGDLML